MIELYFLRHADAGDPMAWTGDDAERPLSDKGRKQADRLGRFLAGLGFAPDAIITSPKVRAAQTAEIVAEHLDVTVAVDDRLAGGLDPGTLDGLLRTPAIRHGRWSSATTPTSATSSPSCAARRAC